MSAEDEDPREESVKVCCRFRPQNTLERTQSGKICVQVPDRDGPASVHVINTDHVFHFDRVFRWDASQKDVYDYAAKPIIYAVLKGFNGTVFAYGQTSSGKTYTMEGPDIEDKVLQGVIPRMIWSIFDGIYNAEDHIEFLVKVSIVEIYNERIRDLLDPKKDNLKVHEDKARGVFIGEVTESYVGCEQEIFDAMRAGQYNRSMAVTNMNEHSSRSHLIFVLTVEQKNLHDRSVKAGKLHLVDLAGSEKVAKTGASGERLDEAKNINRSTKGMPGVSRYLTVFRRGDYVDIVVDSSIQKGMPYSFYHGRTGVVFNVNRNAIGVEVTKIVGNRQLRKRIHVRSEHLRKSRCNEAFLKRVKENDKKKQEAKARGETIKCKREPEGPKAMKIVKAKEDEVEVLAPLPFIENYF